MPEHLTWALLKCVPLWIALGAAGWFCAFFWYWRVDIRQARKARQPHRWGVDLQTGRVTSGRRPTV